jgi:hypothetical protein
MVARVVDATVEAAVVVVLAQLVLLELQLAVVPVVPVRHHLLLEHLLPMQAVVVVVLIQVSTLEQLVALEVLEVVALEVLLLEAMVRREQPTLVVAVEEEQETHKAFMVGLVVLE